MEDEDYKNDTFVDIELHGLDLYIDYGKPRQGATMQLKNSEEAELVKMLLEDNNFWAAFLGSLSAAIGRDFKVD
jgi:hypothetical protein